MIGVSRFEGHTSLTYLFYSLKKGKGVDFMFWVLLKGCKLNIYNLLILRSILTMISN